MRHALQSSICTIGLSRAERRRSECRREFNAFAYVVEGEGLFGSFTELGGDGQMIMFAPDGDEVRIENPSRAENTLDLLLIGGVPLHEPIARYGPFVMNTEAEIHQAVEDYRLGRMGAIQT